MFWLINNCQRCSVHSCASVLQSLPLELQCTAASLIRAWNNRKQTCAVLVNAIHTYVKSADIPVIDTKCQYFLVACVTVSLCQVSGGECRESAAACSRPGHTRLIKFTLVAAWFAFLYKTLKQWISSAWIQPVQQIQLVNESVSNSQDALTIWICFLSYSLHQLTCFDCFELS